MANAAARSTLPSDVPASVRDNWFSVFVSPEALAPPGADLAVVVTVLVEVTSTKTELASSGVTPTSSMEAVPSI